MSLPYFANTLSIASASRMSALDVRVARAELLLELLRASSAVDASSPKNTRRMSLSMPTTSMPQPGEVRRRFRPIRPADPVMMATLIRVPQWLATIDSIASQFASRP